MNAGAAVLSQYFSEKEIKCKGRTCGCNGNSNVDLDFAHNLLALRVKFGLPMNPTSFCRCIIHNSHQSESAQRSFHISDYPQWPGLKGCCAVDIRCPDEEYKLKLAALAWSMGFRIGYHPVFLHLDGGAQHGLKPQTIFKYSAVTDYELAQFKDNVLARVRKIHA